MKYSFKYGKREKELIIPEYMDVSILKPVNSIIVENPVAKLKQSLLDPINIKPLKNCQQPQKIAIAIPDESRPFPAKLLLPALLEHFYKTWPRLKPEQIIIVIGGGLHPPLDKAGIERIIPQELIPGCQVISHDAVNSPMMDYGVTSRGTPIQINAAYAQADFKVILGQIDAHQFVGYTGGAKGVVIGCASEEMIEHNHGLMFHEKAQVGHYNENPVRQDLNEAGEKIGIDLVVNIVLNAEKQIITLLAGEPIAVLKEGLKTCAEVYGVEIKQKYDIVLASCGGYPKDICLYQAQKGLNLASQALKPKGKILLLAECGQGVGDDVYYDYVTKFKNAEEAMKDFISNKFRMGAHKSYLFSRTLTNFEVVLTSDYSSEILKKCHIPVGDAQDTTNQWCKIDRNLHVAIVPNANTTYFITKD
jgi:lactate racemase